MKYSLGGVGFTALLILGMVASITNIAVIGIIAICCAPLTIVLMLVSDYLLDKDTIPLVDLRHNYIYDAKTDEVFSIRGE